MLMIDTIATEVEKESSVVGHLEKCLEYTRRVCGLALLDMFVIVVKHKSPLKRAVLKSSLSLGHEGPNAHLQTAQDQSHPLTSGSSYRPHLAAASSFIHNFHVKTLVKTT